MPYLNHPHFLFGSTETNHLFWPPDNYRDELIRLIFVTKFVQNDCCFSNSAAQRKALIFKSAKLFTQFIFLFLEKKVGKRPVSHRYNRLPLLPSDSGGFQQELVAQDLPGAKVEKFSLHANKKNIPCNFIILQIQIV